MRKLLILFLSSFPFTLLAQVDTISIKEKELCIDQLHLGIQEYLVYIERNGSVLMDASIWRRHVDFALHQGDSVIVVTQEWLNQDIAKTRLLTSLSYKESFAPIFHKSINGQGETEAYNFGKELIEGADSVAENQKADFELQVDELPFNWELDLEILQTLPYQLGKKFYLNFYHAGGKAIPKYYLYEVIGEEPLEIFDGIELECWLLKIKYSEANHATFWISKKSHEVLFMVEEMGTIKRYKKRLF